VPKYLELFCWVYSFNLFTAACETFVRIPFDLLVSIINSIRGFFGGRRMPHTSLFPSLIVFGFILTTRDFYLFSVSYLYHSFRGQSTVKLYGAGLAL
jgi:hypothetical protein